MAPTTLLSSPHSHLTVHHTREIKVGQQILHLVVFLAILLYVAMVTRDIRAQHIPHQEGQTALLTIAVFLKDISKFISILYPLLHRFSISLNATKGCLTFNIRPLAPALKLPDKRHTFTVKQLQKVVRYRNWK